MNYFIKLSYNGLPFSGWQIQNNARSVQGEVQRAFSLLLKEDVEVTGAGRTDAGVSAVNYVAHTCLHANLPLQKRNFKKKLLYKINAILPREIQIHDIKAMPKEAHARFDAVRRTYNYFLTTAPDPFNSAFTYYYKAPSIDFNAMNEAARFFLGEHDFSSLEKVGGQNKTSICSVSEAYWKKATLQLPFNQINRGHTFVFTVSADRFLRNMVRAMVGSLLEVGCGKRAPEWIAAMLKAHDRCSAGSSVPGNALFLTRIVYPYTV